MRNSKIYALYFGDNWITDGYKKDIMNFLKITSTQFNTTIRDTKLIIKHNIKYNINSLRRIIIFIGFDYEFNDKERLI